MKILELNVKNKKSVIDEAVAVFKNGGLVVYPTETCYGAGVMATNENAVKKLLK
ncbi:MAG TPA: Sua5/YciO/YrdC/YwlC family protein, partial [Candidatus Dojkabacteria bacterium]|nr:Sua5/YciO/YrdC/YwlC family protein [Candidatus Dojkabacteria bacterium]